MSSPEITLKPINLKASQEPQSYDLKSFTKLKKLLKEEIIPYNYEAQAHQFIREIEAFFKRNSDFIKQHLAEYQDLQDILIQLRWIALPLLSETDILDLIENHLTEIFEIPVFNLWQKVKSKLSNISDYKKRDDLKDQIKRRLLANKQRLTDSDIVIDKHERHGTTANWLLDYNKKLGTSPVDNLKFTEYITNSQNTQDLTSEERNKLDEVFHLYERLKYSSLTPEGIEDSAAFVDSDGKLKIFTEGRIENIDDDKQINQIMKFLEQTKMFKTQKKSKQAKEKSFVPSPAPMPAAKSNMDISNFHFDETDAQEIDQLRQKGTSYTHHNFADLLKKVKAQIKWDSRDHLIDKRLDTILLSWLKGVRDDLEFLEILRKDVKLGGIAFDFEKANKVLDVLKQPHPPTPLQRLGLRRASRQTVKKQPHRLAVKPVYAKAPVMKVSEVKKDTKELTSIKKPDITKIPTETLRPVKRLNIPTSKRPQMTDVKPASTAGKQSDSQPPNFAETSSHKLEGPIDEISNFTLKDLRHETDIMIFKDKLLDRLQILEQESIDRKMIGIKAWRNCPLNKLYLNLGMESMGQGRSIKEIISNKQAQNKETLTFQEFELISALNEELRF